MIPQLEFYDLDDNGLSPTVPSGLTGATFQSGANPLGSSVGKSTGSKANAADEEQHQMTNLIDPEANDDEPIPPLNNAVEAADIVASSGSSQATVGSLGHPRAEGGSRKVEK